MKDRYFCSCSFLPSWGCLRFWQLNELMAGSVHWGDWLQMRLKSGGFQCGFVIGLSAPTDMQHYFHCSYPHWQHHSANVTRGMFARPLAQTYTWCMYMNRYKHVIVSSYTINHPTNLYFILLFYTWFTPWYQGMVHIIYSPSYRSKLYYFLFPKVQFSKNILFPWVKSVEWMVYSWIGLIWFNKK